MLTMIPASAQAPSRIRDVPITENLLDMTSLASTSTTDIPPIRPSALSAKLAMALLLAALADFLLYGRRIGLSLVILAVAIACASLLANRAALDFRRAVTGGAIVALGLVPAVEELNALSFLILVAALAIALLLATNPETTSLADRVRALRNLVLFGPFRFFPDALQVFSMSAFTRSIALWLMPVVLSTVFVALFAAANPVIEQWVSLLNPKVILEYVSVWRVLFWTLMLALVWPFIHVRWRRKKVAAATETDVAEPAPLFASPEFLGPSTILRSLILFNLLFAAQSILDGIYLWGHVALPDNVTYASYAHRGAYPLIATALLAAAFVLVAMRPGGPAEKSKVIRPLVYLWIGQNVLLVASSILRLDLYVDIYMLTYWRIAAFIWMGLVALGLVLIVTRHRPQPVQPMADRRQPDRVDDRAVRLLARELRRLHCRLQCHPQPGSIGPRRADRHQLSPDARAASAARHRQGDRAAARRRRGLPCVTARQACRTAAPGPGLAELGLPKLAAPAQAGRPGGSQVRQPVGGLTRQRRISWRIAFSSSTTRGTSARSSASP
ncbi:hypothetical protein ABIF91_002445 [Bradyrhizobium sp. USDA 241]